MATLGFNSPGIRNPVAPIISRALVSLSKTLSIPPSTFPSSKARAYRHRHRRRPLNPRPNSISESSVSPPASSKEEEEESGLEEEEEVDPRVEVRYLDPGMEAGSIGEWQLDFCSRPILDERGKKVWELVVCDGTLSLQYTRFFPNNVINSVTLRDAIASISASLGVPLPQKIRFFRSQMQTIITKACNELGIKAVPSKRCLSLLLWLEERYETVYTRHPGFQQGSKPLLALDNPFPVELPENLFGDKWAFVQLPFSAVQEEVSSLETRYAFGASLDLDLLGLEIEDKTLVPGLAVASSRAKPLAAWMNGLEVCSVEVDIGRACLILSVGVATRYIYATYNKNAATTQEAEAWEAAKKACGGLHFLAIQESLDSEDCVGFWLLLDLPPSPV
ncbi:protein TAB2 homolog, chloroplastic [Phoenix dactylifera]|uniref:Protein TAB2 homolog, chloroplastic n=1 Tax=Phoenix dactylifera TaxID=42345 RepID=A0A8B7BJF7_PHODC|nr:protein TAB2 homolog, chloroplastic [Phoenix dactylifera]